jgi:hypothetical protein
VKHLGEVESWLGESDALDVIAASDLPGHETRLYERFLEALEHELAREPRRATATA